MGSRVRPLDGFTLGHREGALDPLGFLLARLVVGVDVGGLRAPMAEPFLERLERHAGGGESRPEGVAEIVEPDRAHSGSLARLLEALQELGAIERLAGVGMREDEVVLAVPDSVLMEVLKLCRESERERHAARRPLRFRGSELAPHVALTD